MIENNQLADVSVRKLGLCLLILRLGLAVVFVMWTLDKFVNPAHTAAIFKHFYNMPGLTTGLTYILGAAQSVLVVAFILGLYRTYSYGLILILHAVTTIGTFSKYIDPWTSPNLLFFAAIPMLSGCVLLWVLRASDIYTIDGGREKVTNY